MRMAQSRSFQLTAPARNFSKTFGAIACKMTRIIADKAAKGTGIRTITRDVAGSPAVEATADRTGAAGTAVSGVFLAAGVLDNDLGPVDHRPVHL